MRIGIIGSYAAKLNNLFLGQMRKIADIDLVGSYEDIQAFVESIKKGGNKVFANFPTDSGNKVIIKTAYWIIEAEIAWPGTNSQKLLDLIFESSSQKVDLYGVECAVATSDILYLLKMSHRYRKNSPHFLKTMEDIHTFRRRGCVIRPEHEEFYKERMAWAYNYSHPKLNQSKGAFFNGAVPYKYDHDSIHEAVKHLDKPAYTYFKPADSEVMVSRGMFLALGRYTQLLSVLEEAYVLALERSQIPYPETAPERSFEIALMKVCTSITSGRWREFAWENYYEVRDMYSTMFTYVDRFKKGLRDGVVKPYVKGN